MTQRLPRLLLFIAGFHPTSHLFFLFLLQQQLTLTFTTSTTLYKHLKPPIPVINMQNEKGQGVSHASDSALPQKVQEKVSFHSSSLACPSR